MLLMFFDTKLEQTKAQKCIGAIIFSVGKFRIGYFLARLKTPFLNALNFYNVPRFACSLSIDSNKALKLPAPKPLAPMR